MGNNSDIWLYVFERIVWRIALLAAIVALSLLVACALSRVMKDMSAVEIERELVEKLP